MECIKLLETWGVWGLGGLAVIGAGPKAAALAVKARVLHQLGYRVPRIQVFERHEVGAHWAGGHGYTSGDQPLCTPPDNDLGYPYRSDLVDASVAERTYQLFSWSAFKVSCPKPEEFSDWTDKGRRRATHEEFAAYLRWAFERAENAPEIANVTALIPRSGTWLVEAQKDTGVATFGPFDGVVVTGPGDARRAAALSHRDNFYNGVNFWQYLTRITSALNRNPAGTVIVYGGGGTAAAILAWFAREGFAGHRILSLTSQAMLYTRGNNVFERRLFSDTEAWNRLSSDSKRAFVNRLNRGVVWDTMADQIARLEKLSLSEGRVMKVEKTNNGGGLRVTYTLRDKSAAPAAEDADLVVDATGFDEWWFSRLLPNDWRTKLDSTAASAARDRDALRDGIDKNLSFSRGWPLPRLHAPMLAVLVGPGTGNLLSLGDLADRILIPYISPPTPLDAAVTSS